MPEETLTLLERLQREAREIMIPKCINPQCDNEGCLIVMGQNGEPKQEQCEYCYRERCPLIEPVNTLISHVLKEVSGEIEKLKKELDGEPLEDWDEDIGYNQALTDAQRVLLGGDKTNGL